MSHFGKKVLLQLVWIYSHAPEVNHIIKSIEIVCQGWGGVVRGWLASDDGNCNYNPMHLAQRKAIIVSFLSFIEKFWQDCYSNSFSFSSVQPNGILKINYLNGLKTCQQAN